MPGVVDHVADLVLDPLKLGRDLDPVQGVWLLVLGCRKHLEVGSLAHLLRAFRPRLKLPLPERHTLLVPDDLPALRAVVDPAKDVLFLLATHAVVYRIAVLVDHGDLVYNHVFA